jgi:phosphate transport system substrate-binding protein
MASGFLQDYRSVMEGDRTIMVEGRGSSPTGCRAWALTAIILLASCGGGSGTAPADVSKAGAHAAANAAETIQNTGSDTLVNLALAWAEAYMSLHPDVRLSVTGGGSGTGIASLINGTIQIANASREMSKDEIAAAAKNGITPVRLTVALDGIAVVVNPANPVNGLTIGQISEIYTGKIRNWKEVGGEDRPIVLLSRESNSGTYVYFLERVIRQGNSKGKELFSPETLLMPSSEGISVEVMQNPNAIGYDGLGYVTPHQKVVAVADKAGGRFILPAAETVLNGTYPIARPLFMYTAGEPAGAVKAYLDWIRADGQNQVKTLGFVPYTETAK